MPNLTRKPTFNNGTLDGIFTLLEPPLNLLGLMPAILKSVQSIASDVNENDGDIQFAPASTVAPTIQPSAMNENDGDIQFTQVARKAAYLATGCPPEARLGDPPNVRPEAHPDVRPEAHLAVLPAAHRDVRLEMSPPTVPRKFRQDQLCRQAKGADSDEQ